jgi:hypothetical protein
MINCRQPVDFLHQLEAHKKSRRWRDGDPSLRTGLEDGRLRPAERLRNHKQAVPQASTFRRFLDRGQQSAGFLEAATSRRAAKRRAWRFVA